MLKGELKGGKTFNKIVNKKFCKATQSADGQRKN